MTRSRFAVVDTETTGLDEEDQAVELAAVIGEWDGERLRLLSTFDSLIRPTVPVKPDARANHHLTDEELARAPPLEKVTKRLPDLSGCAVVAHNLEFDAKMLRQTGLQHWIEGLPSLDTYRLARHAWPDAPSYGNQVLRYYLELEVPGPWDRQSPHRALPDAVVTFALLERELREVRGDVAKLLELTTSPVLLKTCRIGQWRGRPWTDVDSGMLRWILGKDFGEDEKHTARAILAERALRTRGAA